MTADTEIWKPVPKFPGYDVSNRGQVRSYYKQVKQNGWIISEEPQRILKGGLIGRKNTFGEKYPCVLLTQNGNPVTKYVHHLVGEAFLGSRPPGLILCHFDGHPTNNHLDNLRYDTYKANTADAKRHGTFTLAKRPGCPRKFTDCDVIAMRTARAAGSSIKDLARIWNANRATISRICTGRKYADCGGPITNGYTSGLKLSLPLARQIRYDRQLGHSLLELAKKYAVDQSMISRVINGKSWKEN